MWVGLCSEGPQEGPQTICHQLENGKAEHHVMARHHPRMPVHGWRRSVKCCSRPLLSWGNASNHVMICERLEGRCLFK